MKQTITEGTRVLWKWSAYRLRTAFYFAESFDERAGKGDFEIRHPFLYFFSSVRISEFLYANLSLIYLSILYASPKKLARPLDLLEELRYWSKLMGHSASH